MTTHYRYILPVFLVLLAIATYQLYILPLYGDIRRSLAEEVEMRSALADADAAQAKLDEIKGRYESFPQNAKERLDEILPEKIDPILLLIKENAFLAHNGFSVKSLTISNDTAGTSAAPYKKHTITFTFAASYDTFREFLHVLEASLALRDPVSISFTAGALPSASAENIGRPELAIHDYNVQLTGYSLR